MLIRVSVTPKAKKAEVTKLDEHNYEVKIDEIAREGRANARLIELLSEYFNVSKSSIRIIKGAKSRDKIVQVTKPQ
jgi:uncharacterized protein